MPYLNSIKILFKNGGGIKTFLNKYKSREFIISRIELKGIILKGVLSANKE